MKRKLEAKLNNFKQMTKENRVKKVMSMLEVLKEDNDLFQDFYDMLVNLGDNVSEELLESIYTMIVSAIIALEKEETDENLKNLDKIKLKLKKLRELEEKQREEEDPDKLLEEIL